MRAIAPCIFTAAANAQGNPAGLNGNGPANSIMHPALAGSVVVLYATGEGDTAVPGVHARVALDILPIPKASVKVKIGGKHADIQYAGWRERKRRRRYARVPVAGPLIWTSSGVRCSCGSVRMVCLPRQKSKYEM